MWTDAEVDATNRLIRCIISGRLQLPLYRNVSCCNKLAYKYFGPHNDENEQPEHQIMAGPDQ
jgi:hypothetical protein